jgi:hypothetical protein
MRPPTDRKKRPSPEWLRSQWEKKKRETAVRVATAVEVLHRENRAVTYASIREKIHALCRVWISANTIKRNDLADSLYTEHLQTLGAQRRREPLLRRLLDGLPEGERRPIVSKVSRLRREPKDALIAKLILLSTRPLQNGSGLKTRFERRLFVSVRRKLGLVNERKSSEAQTPHRLVCGREGSITRAQRTVGRSLQALHSSLPRGRALNRPSARRPCRAGEGVAEKPAVCGRLPG